MSMPLLLFLLLLSGVYSVTFGNVGTACRHKRAVDALPLDLRGGSGWSSGSGPGRRGRAPIADRPGTEEGPDDRPARPARPRSVSAIRLRGSSYRRRFADPGDRPDTIGAVSRPQLPMRTPSQRCTQNTIRIEPRTTLKSTEKEMKIDGKLPVSQGHKRVSPLRVGPAPVLSALATGNSIFSVNLRASVRSKALVQGLRALRGSSSQIPQRPAGAIECRT